MLFQRPYLMRLSSQANVALGFASSFRGMLGTCGCFLVLAALGLLGGEAAGLGQAHPEPLGGVERVVVDERTGTVVIGRDVKISTVAVTHGNLTVRVTEVAARRTLPEFSCN